MESQELTVKVSILINLKYGQFSMQLFMKSLPICGIKNVKNFDIFIYIDNGI